MIDSLFPQLKGSINIGLGGQFATWVGSMLDRKHQIVIIAAPGHEKEAAIRLGRIGLDFVRGYLKDGLSSLKSHPELTTTTERLSAPFAAEYLSWPTPPLLIDVRAPGERAKKYIAGSLSIPLNHLAEKLNELPKDRPLLVHCAGGYRSSIAASLLQKSGFALVSEIAGGLLHGKQRSYPLSIEQTAS